MQIRITYILKDWNDIDIDGMERSAVRMKLLEAVDDLKGSSLDLH